MSEHITLTPSQSSALQEIISFVESRDPCLILTGGAGTGKTTLIRAVVEALQKTRTRVELLAPTGRAARVLARKTSCPAKTIHGAIYDFKRLEVREEPVDDRDPCLRYFFPLKGDEPGRGVWIVDESSMVGDAVSHSDTLRFGSGRLLSDLLSALRLGARRGAQGSGAQVIFVGDPSQLPPVSMSAADEELSALNAAYLDREHKLSAREVTLKEVMRQAEGSEVLNIATRVREAIAARAFFGTAICFGDEVTPSTMGATIEALAEGHERDLSRALITRSNADAYRAVRAVRERLFGSPDTPLMVGERLLVMRNHHGYQLSNGDLVRVRVILGEPRVIQVPLKGRAPVELSFQRLSVSEVDHPEGEAREVMILSTSLWLDSRGEPPELTQALLVDAERRSQLKRGSEAFSEFLVRDAYFNALRVRFGYALTCHKAQGGEWDEVFVTHEPSMPKSALEARWLYTAITRARRRLGVLSAASSVITSPPWAEPARHTHGAPPSAPPSPAASTSLAASTSPEVILVSDLAGLSAEERVEALARGAFERADLLVEGLTRHQYRLRFSLCKGAERAQVDVQYKKSGEPSQLSALPDGWGVTLEAIRALRLAERSHAALPASAPSSATSSAPSSAPSPALEAPASVLEELYEPAYRALVTRVAAQLSPAGIRVTQATPMSYALRIHLSGPDGEGVLHFTHRGDMSWSSCQALNAAPTAQRAAVLCRG